jgi:glutaredoxin 3
MSAAKNRAQQLINDNAVVVFSKSYCPYCDSSKKLLDGLSAKYTTLELDLEGECFPVASVLSAEELGCCF